MKPIVGRETRNAGRGNVAAITPHALRSRTTYELMEISVTIKNKLGMHARPAMSFVDTANSFKCDIRVRRNEKIVDGKSVMQLMMLGAEKGVKLTLTAEGDDADDALAALRDLVDRGFDEEGGGNDQGPPSSATVTGSGAFFSASTSATSPPSGLTGRRRPSPPPATTAAATAAGRTPPPPARTTAASPGGADSG